ncbi:MAG TPA: hypothetical protein VII51_02890 [Gaiellaceae bacterium]
MIVRCTKRLRDALHVGSGALLDAPPNEDDFYANLVWFDRRKCLLLVHAGTLFPVFVADVRVPDLRPIGRQVVRVVEDALLEEGLPVDAFGQLDPDDVQLEKTASRHVLGVMNEIAFECGWQIDRAGGLWNVKVDDLNHHIRRSLHTKDGDYQVPLELVLKRLE